MRQQSYKIENNFKISNPKKSENRGETCLYFNVYPGNAKAIKAQYTISIDSIKYSKVFDYVYKTDKGYGPILCKTDELFNPKNGYFINDELTIKVNGILEFEKSMVTKLPISVQWTIKESDLTSIKTSTNESLQSKRFNVSSDFDIKYYLRIYPNGNNEQNRGKSIILFHLEFGNGKKIESFLNYSIESAQYSCYSNDIYEKPKGWGIFSFSTEELFDPTKGFIVEGELVLNVKGFLLIEMEKVPNTVLTVKKGIATKKMKLQRNKNFTIIVGENQIKVHKKVLAETSPVFAAMFESNMKESTENKMKITDFSFEVVRAATNLIYSTGVARTFSYEDMISLMQFADKYDIQFIKDIVEEYLIKRITVSNVCQIFNYSQLFNAKKLNKKTTEFLIKCSKESTPVADIESINEKILLQIFIGTFSHFAETKL